MVNFYFHCVQRLGKSSVFMLVLLLCGCCHYYLVLDDAMSKFKPAVRWEVEPRRGRHVPGPGWNSQPGTLRELFGFVQINLPIITPKFTQVNEALSTLSPLLL